jgi:hypothetical protein
VHNGTGPFNFSWSNGANNQNLSGLSQGTYVLTVTDALGCTAGGTVEVPTGCFSLITGHLFNDVNSNCTVDGGDDPLQGIYLSANGNGQTYYGYTNGNGDYSIQVSAAGSYQLSAYSYYGVCGNLEMCGNSSHIITINNLGDLSSANNFSFQGASGPDINIHPGWMSANPGFTKEYWIYYGNNAATAFTGTATLTFTYDSNLIYQSATGSPTHTLRTHTLTWDVSNIASTTGFSNGRVDCSFLVPVNLGLGQPVSNYFHIDPTIGDCDSSNNTMIVSEVVTGSHDPNE